jgi:hypothetical protein
MDLVSELQALQFLKRAAIPSVSWGTPTKVLSQIAPKEGEMATPRGYACPDAARQLRIRAQAAGVVA